MNFEPVSIGEFKVVGISVRTSNKNGQSKKDIGELWTRFISDDIAAKIPNKSNGNLYCIYTNYESDFMGPYTTILGYIVESFNDLPEGLMSFTIPASSYQVYKSSGKLPDCVLQTWGGIWQSGMKRKYLADFDVYPADAFNSENPVVETFLSV